MSEVAASPAADDASGDEDKQARFQNERILIADANEDDRLRAKETLSEFFPNCSISDVPSSDSYTQVLESDEFDIVVLDLNLLASASVVDAIFELKTRDYEPSVIVLADRPPAHVINELYKFGCHRCIVKDERWLEELGTAVDYLIRLRKVGNENLLLRAKLTEANMMLQEKNQRLDEFSATVAHDIRGPLGGISMKLDYILENYRSRMDERFELLITRALSSADRLTGLVQSMYEYAKLGAKAAEMTEIDLEELVREVFEDLPLDESLDIEVALGDLPVVWGNRELLRRVFINFINNAVKFNDKDTIQIGIGVDGVEQRVLAPFVWVFVRDNGPGIPEEDQKDIFSMFQRGAGENGKSEGSGVGLAVVKRIIELHFGHLKLNSELGEGTTFFFSLPLKPFNPIA